MKSRFAWIAPVGLMLFATAGTHCKKNRGTEGLGAVVDRSDGTIPELRVARVAEGSVHLDGRMDEAAWNNAGQTGAFVNPGDGRPESRSRVNASGRMVWDSQKLYVGIIVNDPDPTSPFGENDVDPHLWEKSSAVELMIQPGDPNDNRDYYEIQVNTHRAVWDTHFDDYNNPIVESPSGRLFGHQEWVSHIERAVQIDKANSRYVMELAIPFSSFSGGRAPSPPRDGDIWRVNFYSFRDGQSDSLAWSPILRRGNFHFAGRFGRVRFSLAP